MRFLKAIILSFFFFKFLRLYEHLLVVFSG